MVYRSRDFSSRILRRASLQASQCDFDSTPSSSSLFKLPEPLGGNLKDGSDTLARPVFGLGLLCVCRNIFQAEASLLCSQTQEPELWTEVRFQIFANLVAKC